MKSLISNSPSGLECERGGFHLDPWRPVPLALITHAHGDHARPGSGAYVCAQSSVALLKHRLGPTADIRGVAHGERLELGRVQVSFHPAGHVLGSAQIRLELEGDVWVFSGDYKRAPDPTCSPFEVVACDTFITESTFALPIYRWENATSLVDEIFGWWNANAQAGRAAVLYCYTLGKAQRILAELTRVTQQSVFVHGAIEPLVQCYREAGISMLPTRRVVEVERGVSFAGQLVLAPPSAIGSAWTRRFGDHEAAFASGWMQVRGMRRRRGFDRGFAISDHADWPALIDTIAETGARRVLTTHGYAEVLARYLSERGIEAHAIETAFEGELED